MSLFARKNTKKISQTFIPSSTPSPAKPRYKAQTLIPFKELSPSEYAGQQWTAVDFASKYGIPNPYPPNTTLSYNFNSLGYRCSEIVEKQDEFLVIAIGCSETFGTGLTEDQTYLSQFCELLRPNMDQKVISYNFGLPGRSNDYISRMVLESLSLNPDLYLILFTKFDRREYVDILQKSWDFMASVATEKVPYGMRDFWSRLQWLSNPFENEINFYKNFILIEEALENRRIPWVCSSLEENEFLEGKKNYVKYEYLDHAQDGMHQGIRSNQNLANKFWSNVSSKLLA